MEGKGERKYPNRDIYIGSIIKGQITSPAKIIYASGDIYEGEI